MKVYLEKFYKGNLGERRREKSEYRSQERIAAQNKSLTI